MGRTLFSIVSDVIFLFVGFFVAFFIILNYFIGRVNAIILSLWLAFFFALLTGRKFLKNRRKTLLTASQLKECQDTMNALNFMTSNQVTSIFYKAFELSALAPVKIKGGILTKDNKLYFLKFSFDGITKTDVVRFYNRLLREQTAVICSESFSTEISDFARRFGKRIILLDGSECYALLKKNGCLPKAVEVFDAKPVKIKPHANFVARKNAKKLLLFGVVFCAMSFFVPFKVYYIVCGCLMLFLSITVKLFGKDEQPN